ncbi:hypothetical protein BGX21_005103 [Mortierella sp. AD011]|nr:hypothetical protein BGX20_003742 [Mortierella sp. AD010]KAF9403346.1 hypothetical protein BGX21_005103 [Mortierella sp. AD011]
MSNAILLSISSADDVGTLEKPVMVGKTPKARISHDAGVDEGTHLEKLRSRVQYHSAVQLPSLEQEKIDKEREKAYKEQQKRQTIACTESREQPPPRLQDYCSNGAYISMTITCPVDVVNFQVMRHNSDSVLESLRPAIINVDE